MSSQFFANYINNWGSYGVIASLLISIAIAVAGIIPSVFITGANVLVFGPVHGFIISWAGEVIGAAVSFYLYRLGFKKKLGSLVTKYKLIDRIVSTKGFRVPILIFHARLLPFLPSGIVTLAGAVSSISIVYFLIATALGKIPSIALEALVGYDLINLNKNWIRLVFIVLAVGSVFFLLRKKQLND